MSVKEAETKKWRGTATFTGCGALVHENYPLVFYRERDEDQHLIEFSVFEPETIQAPFPRQIYRQRIDLVVTATEEKVALFTIEGLRTVADLIAFSTGRRTEFSIPGLTTAPPGIDEGPYPTLVFFERQTPHFEPTREISPAYLMALFEAVGDEDDERGRPLIRAMRWLRRSLSARDEIEEFSALAFGLEALGPLLPEDTGKNTSERLKALSQRLGIPADAWKVAGRMRHKLFHGAITDSTESREQIELAGAIARHALILALKEYIGVPPEALPAPTPMVAMSMPAAIFSNVINFAANPGDASNDAPKQ